MSEIFILLKVSDLSDDEQYVRNMPCYIQRKLINTLNADNNNNNNNDNFESQIILAEHECCTNWGDCKSNKSNQIKCWFLRRGENRSSRRKTSQSRVENQQTQPTYDARSGNQTRDTLVEGECSHHYTNPAPQK